MRSCAIGYEEPPDLSPRDNPPGQPPFNEHRRATWRCRSKAMRIGTHGLLNSRSAIALANAEQGMASLPANDETGRSYLPGKKKKVG